MFLYGDIFGKCICISVVKYLYDVLFVSQYCRGHRYIFNFVGLEPTCLQTLKVDSFFPEAKQKCAVGLGHKRAAMRSPALPLWSTPAMELAVFPRLVQHSNVFSSGQPFF